MSLTQLTLTNFRSYADHTVRLDPNATLIVGPNATGKTNLLEGLFVLATTKSFRAKDGELIRHGESFYRVAASLDDTTELTMGYQASEKGTEKRARHGGVAKSLIEHLGTVRVVLFEPGDLLLITGGPDRRRRYLDFVLTQTDKRYAKILNQYRRILQQRNFLLSAWQGNTSELFAWNVQLAQAAAEINIMRRAVVGHVNRLAADTYGAISGERENLGLLYRGVCEEDDYPSAFIRMLEANQARDVAAGFTTIGPHRDDVAISFKGAPITAVASRGEMRTVVMSLKLAELAYIKDQTGAKPLLLLDDVFSELDDFRRRHLLKTLGDYQAVITTTNADVSKELTTSHATLFTNEVSRG